MQPHPGALLFVGRRDRRFSPEEKAKVIACQEACAEDGLRVLGFCELELPEKYNKDYKFDMKNWKSFGEAYKGVSYSSYADQPGTFPMHDLVLCGVVSLNDPPRPKVDISVDKCRQAGIKVIMVTGDQPPTAAAIAEKVNIIKHP